MDVSGEQQIDVETNLLKQRLDASGEPMNESPQEESKIRLNMKFSKKQIDVYFLKHLIWTSKTC